MSPWQLHNSWIVLATHLSFANHNSGCVFGESWQERKRERELQPIILSFAPPQTHTHIHTQKNKPYWKCWCVLIKIMEAESLWKPPGLSEGPCSFMMNSQVCSFGDRMLIPPPPPPHTLSRPSVRLPGWCYTNTVWCNSEGKILIKALVQIICHQISDWIYTETLKWTRAFHHMWARWRSVYTEPGVARFIIRVMHLW